MTVIKIPKDTMLEILDDEVDIVEDEIVDHSRWSVHHRIVFRYGGSHYMTHYSVGATENQCESPWEYDDEVTCTEVAPVEKVVTVWEVIPF